MSGPVRASRIPHIPPEDLSDAQTQLLARVAHGRRRVPTPFRIWLHHPDLGERLRELGEVLSQPTKLTDAQTRLAILLLARRWHATYVFSMHAREARKAGLSDAVIEALRDGREPPLSNADDRLVYALAASFAAAEPTSDDLFARATSVLGHDGIAELLALTGYFTAVALAMKLYQVPVPDDAGE